MSAPRALARRLAQIGLVEAGDGKALHAGLQPRAAACVQGRRSLALGRIQREGGRRQRRRCAARRAEPARSVAIGSAKDAETRLRRRGGRGKRSARDGASTQDFTKALKLKLREAREALDRTRDAIAAEEHEGLAHSKQLGALAEAKSRTQATLAEAQNGDRTDPLRRLELAALAALEEAVDRARGRAGGPHGARPR